MSTPISYATDTTFRAPKVWLTVVVTDHARFLLQTAIPNDSIPLIPVYTYEEIAWAEVIIITLFIT